MTLVPVVDVRVLPGRRPVDPAKVSELADSIQVLGLLNPITIGADNTLIAGAHRLAAHVLLGCTEIEAHVVPLMGTSAKLAELDENLIRNDLTVLERSECLAQRKGLYEELHPATRIPGRGMNQHTPAEMISIGSFADDTAVKTGLTPRTIRQEVQIARAIPEDVREAIRRTELADSKTELLKLARLEPAQQRQVAEHITNGTATRVGEALRRTVTAEKHARPMPEGQYRVVYADPPWRYDNSGFDEAAEGQYPTLAVEDICALPVGRLMDASTVLFLWATNPLLPEALQVLNAWGFSYKTNIAWVKDQGRGKGWFLRSKHELLLIGVRAETPQPLGRPDSCFEAARGPVHSRKPELAYEIIESMYGGPRIELFARSVRPGWDAWGNEPGL